MKRIYLGQLLLVGIVAMATGRGAAEESPPISSYIVGGTEIIIPTPNFGMQEVGDAKRDIFDTFVAPNNRLIAAFVLTEDSPKLTTETEDVTFSKFAMIQVPSRAEYRSVGANDFKEVTAGVKEKFGDTIRTLPKKVQAELDRRIKALGRNDVDVRIGEPTSLGCFFSKDKAYGFGMVAPVTMNGHTWYRANGSVLMRVKEKLLFAYIYADYEGKDTVKWISEAAQGWADAILRANE